MSEPSDEQTAIRELSVDRLWREVAAETPAPGGGSVASTTAALAAGLLLMVNRFSDSDDGDEGDPLRTFQSNLREQSDRLLELAEEDRRAYEAYRSLRQASDVDPEEKRSALIQSTRVPIEIGYCCERILEGYLDVHEDLKSAFQADVRTALGLIENTWDTAENLADYNLDQLPPGEKRNQLEEQLSEIRDAMEKIFETIRNS